MASLRPPISAMAMVFELPSVMPMTDRGCWPFSGHNSRGPAKAAFGMGMVMFAGVLALIIAVTGAE